MSVVRPIRLAATSGGRLARLAGPVLAALVTAALFRPFASIGIDAHHDGLMLKSALDVLSGQVVFRDTFNQYGALTTYVHAAWMALAGPGLLPLRMLTVGLYAIAAFLLVMLWRRVLPPALVALALAVWLVMAPFYAAGPMLPWSSVVALVFQVLSLVCFAHAATARPSLIAAGLAGATASLTLWSRTPVGILLTIALCIAWIYLGVRHRDPTVTRRGLGATLAGAGIVHAVFMGTLVHEGTVRLWFEQIFLGPMSVAGELSQLTLDPMRSKGGARAVVATLFPIRSLQLRGSMRPAPLLAVLALAAGPALLFWAGRRPSRRRTAVVGLGQAAVVGALLWYEPILVETVQGLALLMPALVLGMVCWGLARARAVRAGDARDTLAVALGVAAVASWAQYVPIDCQNHIFWAMSPAIGFVVFALWKLAGYRATPVALVVGILLLPFVQIQARGARRNLDQALATVTDIPVLAGMRGSPPMVADLERVYAAVLAYGRQTMPPSIMLEGRDPLLATFAPDLRNPSPYFVRWAYRGGSAEGAGSRLNFIAQHHPLVIVQPQGTAGFFSLLYHYSVLLEAPTLGIAILQPGQAGPRPGGIAAGGRPPIRPVGQRPQ